MQLFQEIPNEKSNFSIEDIYILVLEDYGHKSSC